MSHDIEHQIESGDAFALNYKINAAHLAAEGLYDPLDEHDACGVGLVA